MTRPLRCEHAGAWYHVMDRGAAKQDIFLFDAQRSRFIDLLEQITDRFGIEIHAYCLMQNHYHLLVHTPSPSLGRAMRHLNGVYAQYFNVTTGRDGPLFRGRYKAIPVDCERYWHVLSRYIHRNPSEAGFDGPLGRYRWSSYRYYLNPAMAPQWLRTEVVLDALGARSDPYLYRAFVETPAGEDVAVALHFSGPPRPYLGDAEFGKRIATLHNRT